MALTTSELQRVKTELGYNLITISAEPYIGYISLFEQVIQPYLQAGPSTTSSTIVTASTTPVPVTLTLTSSASMSVNDTLVIDVDVQQEKSTIRDISGNDVTVLLSLDHSGVYPCTVEGGESIIREILSQISSLMIGRNGKAGTLASIRNRVGIKKAEDIEFFGGGSTLASQGIDPLTQVIQLREFWRDELARVIGVPRLNSAQASGGSSIGMY